MPGCRVSSIFLLGCYNAMAIDLAIVLTISVGDSGFNISCLYVSRYWTNHFPPTHRSFRALFDYWVVRCSDYAIISYKCTDPNQFTVGKLGRERPCVLRVGAWGKSKYFCISSFGRRCPIWLHGRWVIPALYRAVRCILYLYCFGMSVLGQVISCEVEMFF